MNAKDNAVDDSWIDEADKVELLKQIKQLYSTKYTWADDNLMKCLIKYHYNVTIDAMDKEQYLKEKKEGNDSIDNLLERL